MFGGTVLLVLVVVEERNGGLRFEWMDLEDFGRRRIESGELCWMDDEPNSGPSRSVLIVCPRPRRASAPEGVEAGHLKRCLTTTASGKRESIIPIQDQTGRGAVAMPPCRVIVSLVTNSL